MPVIKSLYELTVARKVQKLTTLPKPKGPLSCSRQTVTGSPLEPIESSLHYRTSLVQSWVLRNDPRRNSTHCFYRHIFLLQFSHEFFTSHLYTTCALRFTFRCSKLTETQTDNGGKKQFRVFRSVMTVTARSASYRVRQVLCLTLILLTWRIG